MVLLELLDTACGLVGYMYEHVVTCNVPVYQVLVYGNGM